MINTVRRCHSFNPKIQSHGASQAIEHLDSFGSRMDSTHIMDKDASRLRKPGASGMGLESLLDRIEYKTPEHAAHNFAELPVTQPKSFGLG
jgi:hypothetical protein